MLLYAAVLPIRQSWISRQLR